MRYALIKNGVVDNVILGDEDFVAHLTAQGVYDHIEALDTAEEQKVGGPGWLYDAATGVFTEPVQEAPAPVEVWQITKLAFKNRFPREKWIAARASTEVALVDFFESFDLATFIDLKSAEVIAAVSSLAQEATPVEFKLTQAEVDAVLTVPAQQGEFVTSNVVA
jgi:hypothetical protein